MYVQVNQVRLHAQAAEPPKSSIGAWKKSLSNPGRMGISQLGTEGFTLRHLLTSTGVFGLAGDCFLGMSPFAETLLDATQWESPSAS